MFIVKGEDYELEMYIIFNFKIIDCNMWPRFNDMFYCKVLMLRFIINVLG
jgi:hypothetical protein